MGIKYNECFLRGCKNTSDEGVGFWIMFMPPFGGDMLESGYRFICSPCWREIFKHDESDIIKGNEEMKSYNKGEMFSELCKSNNKFGLYLSYTFNEKMENIIDELKKSVPWLNEEDLASFFFEDSLVFLFDTESEMNEKFSQVYGEDMYTELDYDERIPVYALTCDSNGEFMNENT